MKQVWIPVLEDSTAQEFLKSKLTHLFTSQQQKEEVDDVKDKGEDCIQSAVLIPLLLNPSGEVEVLLTVRHRNISQYVEGEVR